MRCTRGCVVRRIAPAVLPRGRREGGEGRWRWRGNVGAASLTHREGGGHAILSEKHGARVLFDLLTAPRHTARPLSKRFLRVLVPLGRRPENEGLSLQLLIFRHHQFLSGGDGGWDGWGGN